MREKAKQGIIEYFHQKYQGLIIDSLHVANVEPVRQGRVVYKAQYTIKTTDKSDKDVTIKIAINKNDVVYMDKNFHVIDEQWTNLNEPWSQVDRCDGADVLIMENNGNTKNI